MELQNTHAPRVARAKRAARMITAALALSLCFASAAQDSQPPQAQRTSIDELDAQLKKLEQAEAQKNAAERARREAAERERLVAGAGTPRSDPHLLGRWSAELTSQETEERRDNSFLSSPNASAYGTCLMRIDTNWTFEITSIDPTSGVMRGKYFYRRQGRIVGETTGRRPNFAAKCSWTTDSGEDVRSFNESTVRAFSANPISEGVFSLSFEHLYCEGNGCPTDTSPPNAPKLVYEGGTLIYSREATSTRLRKQ